MPELFVFKAGKYPQGDWPVERVQQFVDAYDPENNIEAPVVIGHRMFAMRDADQYAHGWVSKLRMDADGKVYAVINDFSREVRQAIAEKKLRYVSVELYEFDKCKETPGQPPYLRAVALLGRDTPAVAGTKVPMFSFKEHLSGCALRTDDENHIATYTRKVGAEEIQTLSLGTGEEKNEEEKDVDEIDKIKAEIEGLKARIDELEKAVAGKSEGAKEGGTDGAFKNQGAAAALHEKLKSVESDFRKQDAAAFYGKLRDEGKLPPAHFDKAVALDASLGSAERAEVRAMFGDLAAAAHLSGSHVANKKDAPAAAAAGFGDGLTAQIKAYQKANNLSFADAASALFAAKPELFQEEAV